MKPRDFWRAGDAMKDMTWRERADYIWTYYNVHILIAVGLVALLIAVLSVALAPQKQVLISGTTVNVTLTEEGKRYLTDQLFAHIGGVDANRQETQLQEGTMGQTEYGDTTGAEIMTLVGDIAAQSLDYLIMDKLSMEYLSGGGWFGDVTAELTDAQLALFAEDLYKVETAEGEIQAVAIDISGLAFIKDCAPKAETVYLVLPGNTERAEMTDEFVDWLLAWETNSDSQ